MDRLVAYDWPGNVRELANEIERIATLAGPEETIGLDNLSEHVRGASRMSGSGPGEGDAGPVDASNFAQIDDWDLNRSVDSLKRRLLVAAVREAGSKSGAAEKLGIPRQSLQKMIKRLQIGSEELVPRESTSETGED
jgi:sigma-54 specific flagellar transcriptional regulator A